MYACMCVCMRLFRCICVAICRYVEIYMPTYIRCTQTCAQEINMDRRGAKKRGEALAAAQAALSRFQDFGGPSSWAIHSKSQINMYKHANYVYICMCTCFFTRMYIHIHCMSGCRNRHIYTHMYIYIHIYHTHFLCTFDAGSHVQYKIMCTGIHTYIHSVYMFIYLCTNKANANLNIHVTTNANK